MAKKKKTLRPTSITRKILLRGIRDAMFDRYAGDNKTELRPDQKLYFGPDGRTLVVPALNLVSFLSAQNTPSAPKRFIDVRKYKGVAQAILSYVTISPVLIPLTRNDQPIVFNGFDGDEDEKAGIYIHRSVARLDKGIPNPKVRPVVRLPWELSFELSLFDNDEVSEEVIQNLVIKGGMAIGMGTFRGVFGKFVVDKWE